MHMSEVSYYEAALYQHALVLMQPSLTYCCLYYSEVMSPYKPFELATAEEKQTIRYV